MDGEVNNCAGRCAERKKFSAEPKPAYCGVWESNGLLASLSEAARLGPGPRSGR